MRILLVSSAFSGLTQRFYTELVEAGYIVSVELHSGDLSQLIEGVSLFQPDLIICPFLKHRLPLDLYKNFKCLIVHPGIRGDRGPSSLDWAIQNGESEWGVTLLEAKEEMDAGDIWVSKTFPMRNTTKSSLFNREVTQAAIECLWEALSYVNTADFKPEPLDYSKPTVKGRLLPLMKQSDRAINWKKHKTDEILQRIRAADGSPGLLDEINGEPFYLFNVQKATGLSGKPGEVIATAGHAVCRATVDGAIWIGHLQPLLESGVKGIKLPATAALKDFLSGSSERPSLISQLLSKPIRRINIDYKQNGKQLPFQEVWYEIEGPVAYLHFAFHNGGMSTEQCQLLLSVYQHIITLDTKVVVLMGGEEFWSNGIHLNQIENASNPADESWANINAIDDLIYQIITTLDKLTISAVAGNAGAGGAILAIAADRIFAREGIIFNPHYKNMGELYGSEYWTYLLPKRVGLETAMALTEQRLPVSSKKAWRLGLIDKVLDKKHQIFYSQVKNLAKTFCVDPQVFNKLLSEKAKIRCFDESVKPLSSYRRFELTQMYGNFYGNEKYHIARKEFVYKNGKKTQTPANIAIHRQSKHLAQSVLPGSLGHFIWQDSYRMGDELMDSQHKDFFVLANQLINSESTDELISKIEVLNQHVKKHFNAEEEDMKRANYHNYNEHISEHQLMLKNLMDIEHRIKHQNWAPQCLSSFIDYWGKHIIDSDMSFSAYLKQQKLAPIH